MANPTQGEWQVREYSVFAGDKMILMSAVRYVNEEERTTNLKLAAAAPDLLEALDILLAGLKKNVDMYSREEKIKIAEAAIKKATY